MQFDLRDTIALLTRTPIMLNALLRELPGAWTLPNEGEKTWSVFDVIGHLIHGERTDWIVRTKIILASGEHQPFERFDRWAQKRDSQCKSLSQLLDEFQQLR